MSDDRCSLIALLVEPEPGATHTAEQVRGMLEALDFELATAETPEDVADAGRSVERIALVLLGPTLARPVAAARSLARQSAKPHLAFLRDDDSSTIRAELGSPAAMVSSRWSVIDLHRDAVEPLFKTIAENVRQRAHSRTTLGRMNHQLSTQAGASRSKVSRYTASQRFLANIIEDAQDAIIGTAIDGTVVVWNGAASKIFDLTWEDAVGRNVRDVSGGEWRERLPDIVRKAIDSATATAPEPNGDADDGVHRHDLKLEVGKRTIDIEVMISPIVEDDTAINGLSLVVRDVTVRKALEERVQANKRAESLGVLAGGIAHKFNNILTGIMGRAELAGMETAAGSDAAQHLKIINDQSEKAAELCRQILVFAGGALLHVSSVNLTEVVRDMRELLLLPLPSGASLELDLENDLPLIDADAGTLRHLLLALVTNAGEAISDGSGRVSISTESRTLAPDELAGLTGADEPAPGRYVVVEIADSGCGMTDDVGARIYEPFFTTKFTGRGLGLSEVLGIVKAHHGGMAISSTPGEGTTARVYLPVRDGS